MVPSILTLSVFCFSNILGIMGNALKREIVASPAEPEEMEKIGESLWDVADSHHIVLVGRKLWLFSKKYVAQPTYNWGHQVTFQGGYSTYFSLDSKQWSQKVKFPALRDDENMEEFLFVLNSNIFLLLFSNWGGIAFKHLYIWDEVERDWHEHKGFEIDPSCNQVVDGPEITKIIAVDQDQPSSAMYFISYNGHSTRYYQISLDDNVHAKLSFVHEIIQEDAREPVLAARVNDKIYWLEGSIGCRFILKLETLWAIDTKTYKVEEYQIEGEKPPFDGFGAKYTRMLPSGQWVHATGSVYFGMYGSSYSGEVWSLNLRDTEFTWKKLDVEVPEGDANKLLVALSEDGVLYAVDPKFGVLERKLLLS